jgi:hypothetical protein
MAFILLADIHGILKNPQNSKILQTHLKIRNNKSKREILYLHA